MTATAPDLDFDIGLNLDAERDRRAAAREVKADTFPIRLGGQVVATIPTELPIDVLAPLRRLDEEITLLLRTAMTAMNAGAEAQQRFDAASLIVDILAANPALPTTVVDVIHDMAVLLMGQDGYDGLMAARPSKDDMSFLGLGLLRFYGLTLGESRPSSDSSSQEGQIAGETSKPTSLTTTPDSTPEESGPAPVAPASSEPDASSA